MRKNIRCIAYGWLIFVLFLSFSSNVVMASGGKGFETENTEISIATSVEMPSDEDEFSGTVSTDNTDDIETNTEESANKDIMASSDIVVKYESETEDKIDDIYKMILEEGEIINKISQYTEYTKDEIIKAKKDSWIRYVVCVIVGMFIGFLIGCCKIRYDKKNKKNRYIVAGRKTKSPKERCMPETNKNVAKQKNSRDVITKEEKVKKADKKISVSESVHESDDVKEHEVIVPESIRIEPETGISDAPVMPVENTERLNQRKDNSAIEPEISKIELLYNNGEMSFPKSAVFMNLNRESFYNLCNGGSEYVLEKAQKDYSLFVCLDNNELYLKNGTIQKRQIEGNKLSFVFEFDADNEKYREASMKVYSVKPAIVENRNGKIVVVKKGVIKWK